MQDHKQMQALLVTYDELDGPTRQQVDDHLATCPACAATLAAYQQSDHLLRAWLTQKEMSLREQPSWSSVTPPMWVQRTRPRQRTAWRDHWAFRLSRLRPHLSPVAWAGLLLLLLGLLLFSFSGWLPIAEPVRAATPTVVMATAEAPAIRVTPAVTDGKTTIRFAVHRWGEANFLQLIREFEEANPDLAIELVIIERLLGKQNESDWAASDFTQAAPSVDVLAGYPSLADLQAGLVRDLMPFFTADASLAVTDFYSGTLAANQWQGGLWALPSTMHVNLIYYDKAAFDEAGISYPKPGWTWHEFVEIAKALTSYDRDTVTRWGFVESLYTPLTTIESQVGPLWDTKTTPVTVRLLDPEVLTGIQQYADLYTKYQAAPYQPRPTTDSYAESPLIALQQAAMWPGSALNWQWLREQRNIGVVPYPINVNNNQTSPLWISWNFFMSANTKHPEAAWRWMRFLTNHVITPDAEALPLLPIRKSVAETTQVWEKLDKELAVALRYALDHGYTNANLAYVNSEELFTALDTAFAAILQEQKSVEAAMAEVQAVAERALATAPAPSVTATPSPSTDPVLENRNTITYIAPYGRTGQDDLYNLAAQFETSHPTVTVQIADALLRDPLDLPKVAQRADCFNWTPIVYEPDGRNLVLSLDAF